VEGGGRKTGKLTLRTPKKWGEIGERKRGKAGYLNAEEIFSLACPSSARGKGGRLAHMAVRAGKKNHEDE